MSRLPRAARTAAGQAGDGPLAANRRGYTRRRAAA
jgi:hypothetical protein